MSFPRPAAAARKDSGGLLDHGRNNMCGLGSQRGIATSTVPCALNSVLRGHHCPAVGSVPGTSWDLTLTLTLPRTRTLHRNLSLARSLILQLSCLLAWALTSALEEDHETTVASALAVSLDQTLTLANNLVVTLVTTWTQFQRLKTPRAWGPEAVQAHAAWNMEAHHVVSQAWLQLPERIPEAPPSGADRSVRPWQAKRDLDRHCPLCPQCRPTQRPRPCCGYGAWSSWELTPTLTLRQTGNLHRNLSLPRTLILHLSCLRAWALTSAIEGHHENGVALALATSLDRTLTLAEALSPWGPNSKV